MAHHTLRDAFVYGVADLQADMPRAAIAFAVIAGGGTLMFLAWTLLSYLCLDRRWNAEYLLINGEPLKRKYPSPWRSARYLSVFLIMGLLFVSTIWFSGTMVGFNPWTTAAATIGISVIMTYGFSQQLSMTSAAIVVHSQNSIEPGQFWRFMDGEEWSGIISAVNLWDVELINYDEKTKSARRIVRPIDQFFSHTRMHIPLNELTMPEVWLEHDEIRRLTHGKAHFL